MTAPVVASVTELILTEAAREDMKAYIARLQLTATFALLTRIHKVYGERKGYTSMLPTDTKSPLAKWHASLQKYLAAVIFSHGDNESLLSRLTAPFRDHGRRGAKGPEAETEAEARDPGARGQRRGDRDPE